MTLQFIIKMMFRYLKAVSLNEQTELFTSIKYSVCLTPVHLTWSGTYTVVSKNKKMIQLCTNTANLLLRKTPLGEQWCLHEQSALAARAIAREDFPGPATHSSCPLTLPASWAQREHSFQDNLSRGGNLKCGENQIQKKGFFCKHNLLTHLKLHQGLGTWLSC